MVEFEGAVHRGTREEASILAPPAGHNMTIEKERGGENNSEEAVTERRRERKRRRK